MWKPKSLPSLNEMISVELEDCAPELRALYARAAIAPEKWALLPWSESGGGFWAVAVMEGWVLWYNDIEEGFNVSPFPDWGEIGEYLCNQDELRHALLRFAEASRSAASSE